MPAKRLDEWYRLINGIYLDRNFFRTPESLLCHLVEVGGGLSLAASGKKKGNLDPKDFIPKTIAWWLALCGRVGIPSVERMLWAKFPRVCPYCRLPVHDGNRCKRQPQPEIAWTALKSEGDRHSEDQRPRTLAEWQRMFGTIYVKDSNTSHSGNFSRLAEEFGELAEAVRTLPVAPQYFVCEAPDVFAWTMSFANQFDFTRDIQFEEYGRVLEDAMEREYPNSCRVCGWEMCKCPPVPAETLGRITKDAPLDVVFGSGRPLFRVEESMAWFRRAEVELEIGTNRVRTDRSELDKIASDVGKILAVVQEQAGIQPAILVNVATTLGKVEALARQGAITQATLNAAVEALKGLPSEKRTAVLGFMNNMAASATFQAVSTWIPMLLGSGTPPVAL